ncbi:transcriptional regulator, AraC family with amidase-like domain [Acidocella aminolytica 101 = DSM 11237]|jgi:transcriptional regulator GlxA family with amidase domain|nr:GlxA family transcriptional regulator [Acidocella aminolytica]SHF28313.1 transcriptional regulator, AraC family with amidase-like domain [Acidocella aminolytica 101 = DSM 11237]
MIPHFLPPMKNIAIFLFEDFQILDATGPIAAFEIAERIAPGSYHLKVLSMEGGTVRSSSGITIDSAIADSSQSLDTLIVVGGKGSRQAMHDHESTAYLRARAENTRRLCSVCSGAFLLAAAGLLEGKRATTHWHRSEELQRLFPAIRVEADRIHIRDGTIWTSAGISAGIDLALALTAEDLGEAIAKRVAQQMVVYYRRPGGQSQFSALAELGSDATSFSSLFEYMRTHLSERLTVEQLAAHIAMSPRNFARAFVREVGISPAKAVERLRLEVARERVETSREPIEQIASSTGFNDPERMRRAFVRHFGQPPQALRRVYAQPNTAGSLRSKQHPFIK